ncbi:hypothetical protein TCAL_09100 [Tigriopus californicus]|uniref:COX assembly mitochondrial protein n=1 Tax=Tigriopus californicus TaxID=6832 RepID=A0A553N9I8_TIGCA|nr:COX assembly mitochondrial protein 2 homolog [Tigriopus californicus]TRY62111.1 hypothetical protein TCAL_09100 [Tigriopus californicus]|eukprot:TCALIF_09100-PA protein Name:"Similar to cmc2 COX assembly mitochondrial protein 2 homolog (Danio rerio)" AED:0.13 eAED:0.13 QI:0/-1/0/1/-1/1/1/0/107
MSSDRQSGPLSPHLHTDECNRIIEAMYRCFDERYLVTRLFGSCDQEFMAMKRCTRAERIARHQKHNADAAEKRARRQEAQTQETRQRSLDEILESIKSKRNKRDTPN